MAKDTANKDLIKPEDNFNSPNVNVHTLTINQSNTVDHHGADDQNVNAPDIKKNFDNEKVERVTTKVLLMNLFPCFGRCIKRN